MAEVYTVVPLTPLRKIIAARMAEAKRTIPHFRVVAEIEMGALFAAREQANAGRSEGKASINDCIVKASASALLQHPEINVQLVGEEIHRYHQADISVVIAVEGGVSTPVVRAANEKSVWEIAKEVKALAARASAGKLRMSEILGGSFSVSNLGAYDVDQFDAIINPPQCAILAVGTAKPRIVAATNGAPRFAKVLKATLSVDHRAIDGAVAAAFIATLRQTLERPHRLFTT